MNWDDGVGVCCWESPSREALEALFERAGTPFDTVVAVEEHVEDTLV